MVVIERKLGEDEPKDRRIPSIVIPVIEDVLKPGITRGVAHAMSALGHDVTVGYGEPAEVDGVFRQIVEVGVFDLKAKRTFDQLSNVAMEGGITGLEKAVQRMNGGVVWEAPNPNPNVY